MNTHGFKFEFTEQKLKAIIGDNAYLTAWYTALCEILPKYEINTEVRVAAFLAQCSHESGKFKVLSENLKYSAERLHEVFPKYFATIAIAQEYANKPEKIANRVYADRMGNGPESSGDGYKFRGRGLIQLTGHENYKRFADSLGVTIDDVITYMDTFEGVVQSACFFWFENKLNQYSDSKDIKSLTKKINGGFNGLAEREANYALAMDVLTA